VIRSNCGDSSDIAFLEIRLVQPKQQLFNVLDRSLVANLSVFPKYLVEKRIKLQLVKKLIENVQSTKRGCFGLNYSVFCFHLLGALSWLLFFVLVTNNLTV
jgi:hypothetical protein